jgi:hypothetical protein
MRPLKRQDSSRTGRVAEVVVVSVESAAEIATTCSSDAAGRTLEILTPDVTAECFHAFDAARLPALF